MSDKLNRYKRLIEAIFFEHFQPGVQQFEFPRKRAVWPQIEK
jgi:hypothetical protein